MSATILVVDDEETPRQVLNMFLTGKGYEVLGAATLEEARESIRRGNADIILLDILLPDGNGASLLEETAHLPIRPPIILITAVGDIEKAVDAMKNGAFDFMAKPVKLPQLEQSIQRALEIVRMRRELDHMRSVQNQQLDFIPGKTEAMQYVLERAQRIAQSSLPVLITGATGTGKEVIAQYIRICGPRAKKPWIPINCAAIQPTIIETELFGYEAGAFTNAEKRKLGMMELADEGILFLDEISSMSTDMQSKLLRAIETQTFRRVGGTTEIKVDVQVVAASNRDIPALIEEGKFREDLYYRLGGFNLRLPTLKERKEDIPELVGHFIRKSNMQMGRNILDITPRAMEALIEYSWPGNIRELLHVIEIAVIFCDDAVLDLPHLPQEIVKGRSKPQ